MSKPRFDTMTENGLEQFFAAFVAGKTSIDRKEVDEIINLLKDPSKLPLVESLGALERRIMMILHDFCGWTWANMTWGKSYMVERIEPLPPTMERIEPLRVILSPQSEDAEELDLDALEQMINMSHDWTVHKMRKRVTGTKATMEIEIRRKRCV